MNVTSILLKKIILEADSETWARIRKHYLPSEYQPVYSVVNKYFEDMGHIPSFDALKLSVRSNIVLDKIYAIQASEDVELPNDQLLEFLKNEFTQEEIMESITKYLEDSIMMESAKENVEHLQSIIFNIEDKVDLKDPAEDMGRIELFDSEEDLKQAFPLGLNADFDAQVKWFPGDYILIGGKRGSGKSLTCSNISVNEYERGRSSLYFTIEMPSRSILQRNCAIATGIPARSIKMRNLSHSEWQAVAKWWAGRFNGGAEIYNNYLEHNSFDKLHQDLTKCNLNDVQMDVIHDPHMTLATIKSELDRKVDLLNPSVIIVDYVNQITRTNRGKNGQYDWTEQIEISKELKAMAQDYKIPLISPYQIDASGEARFSKGLLDSCDAAFTLNAHSKADACITFECVKMRGDDDEVSFTSRTDWKSLRIGPETALSPEQKETEPESDENSQDLPFDA